MSNMGAVENVAHDTGVAHRVLYHRVHKFGCGVLLRDSRSQMCVLKSKITGMRQIYPTCLFADAAIPLPRTGFHWCLILNVEKWNTYFILPHLVLELVETGLVLWVCIRNILDARAIKNWNGRSLITIILRDSVLYFLGSAFLPTSRQSSPAHITRLLVLTTE
jgi:hypothetical protein